MQGREPAEWPQFPFCSDRCRLIDLGRWLGEDYRYRVHADATEEQPSGSEDLNESP
jgi:endogenous inhibitor of DNA gyrase (YacG/DUF329 family)